MKASLPLCFMIVFCIHAAAQSNRIPGYVVNTQGDTSRGFIVDKNDNWTVKSIEFSKDQSGSTQSYNISDINSIYLQTYDAFYYSRLVKFDKKPSDLGNLDGDGKRNFATEQILLKLLVNGTLSLFTYTDENNKVHYFFAKDGKIEELELVRYMTGGRLAELPFYHTKLQQLAQGCDAVKGTDLPLDDKPLIKFVSQYNSCFRSSAPGQKTFVSAPEKGKVLLGVIAGGQSASLDYQSGDAKSFSGANHAGGTYPGKTSFYFGLNLEFKPGRASTHSRPGFQVVYQNFPSTTRTWSAADQKDVYTLSLSTIRIGPSYKYLFVTGKKVSPYFKAEAHGLLLTNSKSLDVHTDVFGDVTTHEFVAFKNFGFSTAVSFGVIAIDRINAELRYNPSFISLDTQGLLVINSLELGLGYLFNK